MEGKTEKIRVPSRNKLISRLAVSISWYKTTQPIKADREEILYHLLSIYKNYKLYGVAPSLYDLQLPWFVSGFGLLSLFIQKDLKIDIQIPDVISHSFKVTF